ncbi:MAG TPA: helix-turn-helix transcriptional regulator [Thermoanaerobaculia bacterium]|nr:helix-turn-helix transcriptional regulator [Thermoanaerobaculia bacterium]
MKNRMRVLRAEKDWTQAELAAMVGVSRQAIVAVENGKYEPALPLAFRIARALGKTVEDVFLWEEQGPKPCP